MKKFFTFLSLILIIIIKSQTVSDYKYILIPAEFNDFKENRSYGLRSMMQKSLAGKKYTVLSETKTDWPTEALTNPCTVLTADLSNEKSMFRNKIILQFKDCNNQVLVTEKGSSMIKEFEPGFQDALKQALLKIPVSNPKEQSVEIAQQNKPAVAMQTSQESKPNEAAAPIKAAQKFRNGNSSFQKIQIDSNQFILIDGVSSVPFASFRTTTKSDVFRVKLSSGESTIGYFENGNIVIEMPRANGEYSKDVFLAD